MDEQDIFAETSEMTSDEQDLNVQVDAAPNETEGADFVSDNIPFTENEGTFDEDATPYELPGEEPEVEDSAEET